MEREKKGEDRGKLEEKVENRRNGGQEGREKKEGEGRMKM